MGQRGGSLLLENKYFNGRTDEHLQTVSIRGGGDFRVEIPFLSEQFVPLTLVRVYGRVSRNENGLPVVTPRYIRAWNWGQFNFDDYGEDRSNPLWSKGSELLRPEPVYQSEVTADYYIRRLRADDGQAEQIRKHFAWEEGKKARAIEDLPREEATEPTTSSVDGENGGKGDR